MSFAKQDFVLYNKQKFELFYNIEIYVLLKVLLIQ